MEAASPPPLLPLLPEINPTVRSFLDARFRSAADLAAATGIEAEIRGRCAELQASVSDLSTCLEAAAVAYSSCLKAASSALHGVRGGISALKESTSETGVEEAVDVETEQVLFEQLPALASEVARMEMIREYSGVWKYLRSLFFISYFLEVEVLFWGYIWLSYTEMALKLDRLVGDVEDAVSSSVTGKLKSLVENSEKTHHVAIGYLKSIEDLLDSVTATRPQWARLLSAVDHRVDRSLAILRPQAIVDHRALLSSLGWPPSLAGSKFSSADSGKQAEIVNPLFSMTGDLKTKYSESFLSLCNLQELQKRRKARQLKGHNVGNQLRQPLWRFVDSMDEILQPLVDKANLIGYSCREEWISGMVFALSTYLAKEIFPKQIELLQETISSDSERTSSQARVSWLSLVDLMISFDKRTQDLISSTGFLLAVKDDDNWQRISVLSVFCDRPDWLEIWAEIERQDTIDKLKSAMEMDKNWSTRIQGTMLEYDLDDYKAPAITFSVQQGLTLLIDRARPIPSIPLRAEFIRVSASPIILEFLGCMLRRCQEAEGLTALADDNALLKVSQSINAARHLESTLTEWCEDVFFLEMENLAGVNGVGGCIFQQKINHLKEFRVEWVDKISTVILRAFGARSWDYLKNKRQWLEKSEGPVVSRIFVESVDYIQGRISKLEGSLNTQDFVTVWRSVATGVDQLLFTGIFTSGTKISNGGVERFQGDLSILFAVFSAWCLRPEGFFPRLTEGLRLLMVDEKQQKDGMYTNKNWLKEYGIRHLTAADAERIIKNRVYEA
ncbi:hypothetical protein PR202_gb09829 [Eleusine coracana subsp. coracana]|uniref:RINT1-like protein MAG2 n=1 Tax=Eleusine coracana subsp. coracana TaxID=191504 RepID=A0AAV5EIL0_ELECO|nr:hypothetical protein PR202_gb09829 [Eleusine coracana subsp. coracana]